MSRYEQDPSDQFKSQPKPLRVSRFINYAVTQSATMYGRGPQSVVVAKDGGGEIGFFFGTSASFSEKATTEMGPGTATGSLFLSESVHYTSFGTITETGNIMDIQPSAWSGSEGASVVFIYKGEHR